MERRVETMGRRHEHKLDPRLRRLADWRPAGARTGARKTDRDVTQVFVEVANKDAADWIKQQPWVHELVHVVDGYYTATVPAPNLADLANGQGIVEVEAPRLVRPHLARSVASIHGHRPPTGGGSMADGKGVMIGIVDYGLDVTLKDFQHPDGKTRVDYLWDQQLEARTDERVPKRYGYGVEYCSEDIDRGPIRHEPLNDDPAISGHGTHVAGIAAGNGETCDRRYPAGKYVGVAPAATLVFVNVNRGEMLEQIRAARGTMANSIKLAHAIAYCFEKADERQMPCVVNISMGFQGGGHDGNTAVECVIEALLRKPGRAVVIAAGNDDGAKAAVYASGSLKESEETALEWKIGDEKAREDDPTANEVEVWYPRGSKIKVWLVAPDGGELSRKVSPGENRRFEFGAGEEVLIHSDPGTPWNGAARIHIGLNKGRREKGIRSGIWLVKLKAMQVSAHEARGRLRFDAWIEREVAALNAPQRSRFTKRDYDSRTAITLTTPSTARRAITIASCLNHHSSRAAISTFSGRGPTRDGRFKPELAAPGEAVLSANARAGQKDENGKIRVARVAKAGTSMAAPHVAGVVARMLSRNAYLTAEEISDILVRTATRPRAGARWNPKWGYGKVNAALAIDVVERLLGSNEKMPRKAQLRPSSAVRAPGAASPASYRIFHQGEKHDDGIRKHQAR